MPPPKFHHCARICSISAHIVSSRDYSVSICGWLKLPDFIKHDEIGHRRKSKEGAVYDVMIDDEVEGDGVDFYAVCINCLDIWRSIDLVHG